MEIDSCILRYVATAGSSARCYHQSVVKLKFLVFSGANVVIVNFNICKTLKSASAAKKLKNAGIRSVVRLFFKRLTPGRIASQIIPDLAQCA